MAISKCEQFEHITPSKAELQPFHIIYCQATTKCPATFTNAGNYELHLQKHHKIPKQTKASKCLYHCPVLECIYNLNSKKPGRHFKQMKNLRQHFQKVHYKNFICESCGSTFPTEGQLKSHAEKACGKRYNCMTCDMEFGSKLALTLHCKRKKHILSPGAVVAADNQTIKEEKQEDYTHDQDKILTTQNKDTQTALKYYDSETQTDQSQISYNMETQTDYTITELFNDINYLHDIETQTEPPHSSLEYLQRNSSPFINSSSSGGVLIDQMLSQTSSYAHMHTQTGNNYLLSEFGLSDIQTQTNWTAFTDGSADDSEFSKHMRYATASASTSTTGFAHDELLVSTETQTSFTQCLLDSHVETRRRIANDNASNNANCDEDSNAIYNTQYTQTCDLLLEGLFGGQENDLITCFQSAYTQT